MPQIKLSGQICATGTFIFCFPVSSGKLYESFIFFFSFFIITEYQPKPTELAEQGHRRFAQSAVHVSELLHLLFSFLSSRQKSPEIVGVLSQALMRISKAAGNRVIARGKLNLLPTNDWVGPTDTLQRFSAFDDLRKDGEAKQHENGRTAETA